MKDQLVVILTGQYAIGVDLTDGKEIFNTKSEGWTTPCIEQKPIILQDKKIMLDGQ